MQRACVLSLVKKLRSHTSCSVVKKNCYLKSFWGAKFVSISMHLGKKSDNTVRQTLGTFCFSLPSVLSCPISRQTPSAIQHSCRGASFSLQITPPSYTHTHTHAHTYAHMLLATINWYRHWQFTEVGQILPLVNMVWKSRWREWSRRKGNWWYWKPY